MTVSTQAEHREWVYLSNPNSPIPNPVDSRPTWYYFFISSNITAIEQTRRQEEQKRSIPGHVFRRLRLYS